MPLFRVSHTLRIMITFSALSGGACRIVSPTITCEVFPETVQRETWTLLSQPEESMRPKVVSWPGEYDFGGMTVRGIGQEAGKRVSYTCQLEGIRFAFIGSPVLEWNDAEIEALGDIDILVIAADDPKKVNTIVEDVDPRIVILYEAQKGSTALVAKAIGVAAQTVKDFKVKSGAMPTESRQVVILGEP